MGEQGADAVAGRVRAGAKDDEARGRSRREAHRIGEVEVQGDEGAAGYPRRSQDRVIGGPGERLVVDGVDLVARLAEHLGMAEAEVLVELQPHATSTNRPAATRAA